MYPQRAHGVELASGVPETVRIIHPNHRRRYHANAIVGQGRVDQVVHGVRVNQRVVVQDQDEVGSLRQSSMDTLVVSTGVSQVLPRLEKVHRGELSRDGLTGTIRGTVVHQDDRQLRIAGRK
jgi:hypothetical protein